MLLTPADEEEKGAAPPLKYGRFFEEDFVNHKKVGQGSFFEVFRAESKSQPPQVCAIKRSLKSFKGKRDRSHYLREIEMVAGVGRHENIIHYMKAWQEELHFFVQMEFCPSNLSDYVDRISRGQEGGRLIEAQLADFGLQIARGLRHIHSHSPPVIHMDIKPDNILVDGAGVLKLGDFGQAVRLQGEAVPVDGNEGDSQYLAPEVLKNEVSPAADVFSLGLLLLQLATGLQMPSAGPLWHALREGGAAQHIPAGVSAPIRRLILDLLSPSPQDRPTAAQLCEQLADLLAGGDELPPA